MRTTKLLGLVLSTLMFQVSIGQIYDNSFDPVSETSRMAPTPNSPEAQAFTKYGDISVSMYSGTPNVQVPLFVFKGRELDLPISLTYDASGVKVEQLASTVGLGWNLNVGGRISRITNGLPDDFINQGNTDIPYKSIWDTEVKNDIASYQGITGSSASFPSRNALLDYMLFLRKINENQYDTQPDYFSFNALGNSDTFVVDLATGNPKALNNPRNIVQLVKGYGAANPITKWVITTDDGTTYEFELAEVTRDTNLFDQSSTSFYGLKKEYNSSWLLTKIVSATGKDTYEFSYTDLGFWTNNRAAATFNGVTNALLCGANNTPMPTNSMGYTGGNDYKVKQLVLNKIKHNNKTIVSVNSVGRADMDVDSAIEDIYIFKDYNESTQVGDLLQSFHFNYDYFRTSTATQPYNPLLVRLKLDEIEIKGNDGVTENKYAFQYIDPYNLPSTTSKAQDYLGYYNGATSNSVLYPKAPAGNCMPSDGANRDPNINFAQKGLLSKITYPTGGFTEFDYESDYEQVVSSQGNSWVTEASVTLTNGTSLPNYNSSVCNTSFLSSDVTPSTANDTFSVASNNTDYQISWQYGTTTQRGYTVNNMFSLVKIASANTTLTWSDVYDNNCNVNTGVEVVWSVDHIWDGNLNPIGGNITLTLEAGHYQLLSANPFQNYTSVLTAQRNQSITNYTYEEKAGIRIKTIKDYSDVNELATQKSFEYPSGTVISNPIYTYTSNQYALDQYSNIVQSEILHRVSSASAASKTHIGYSKVIEKKEDFSNPSNSLETEHQFYTTSYGNYRDGVYTYYINGKETAKQYGVTYELGKPSTTKNYDDTGNMVAKSSQTYSNVQYYSNTGSYIIADESKNELYPIPTQHPLISDHWYITYLPATKIPGYAGGLLGQGTGGIHTVPPSQCNLTNFRTNQNIDWLCKPAIGRLSKQNVSAYGKVGNTIKSVSTQYFNAEVNKIEQVTNYEYYDESGVGDPVNYLLKEQSTSNSLGETVKQEIFYPENLNYTSLVNKNMVNIPVQTRVFKGGVETSNKRTFYSGILPDKISVAKGGRNLEDRLLFERYENNNLVQAKQVNGTNTSYIWGYEGRYIIAKIENATYSQIEALSSFGYGFTIADGLTSTQEDQLRGLSGVMVTTYTYEPLVGVKSITDPRGNTITYEYDAMNRLILIKDQDGNIVSENGYNYKN